MLFRKKIEKSCTYCRFGTMLEDDIVLCTKKGVADASKKCKRFSYDPTKRIPVKPKVLDFEKYDSEDYSL